MLPPPLPPCGEVLGVVAILSLPAEDVNVPASSTTETFDVEPNNEYEIEELTKMKKKKEYCIYVCMCVECMLIVCMYVCMYLMYVCMYVC